MHICYQNGGDRVYFTVYDSDLNLGIAKYMLQNIGTSKDYVATSSLTLNSKVFFHIHKYGEFAYLIRTDASLNFDWFFDTR